MRGFGGLIALVCLLLLANIGASATVLAVNARQHNEISSLKDAMREHGFWTEEAK